MESLNLENAIRSEETPQEFRRESDPMHRLKTIGFIGGVSLLTNNITGPGMIAIPPLFQSVRYYLSGVCILLAYLGSAMLWLDTSLPHAFLCTAFSVWCGDVDAHAILLFHVCNELSVI